MIIYYNANCSKCREAEQILTENSCDFIIREYLKQPPTKNELKDLLAKLGCKPFDIVRQKEELFQKKFLGKRFTDEEWIQILTEHPELIERPIIIDGYKAIVGRPPEKIIELINRKK